MELPYLQKHREEFEHCMTLVVEMPYQYGMIAKVTENANLFIKDFENEYTSGTAIFHAVEILCSGKSEKMFCIEFDTFQLYQEEPHWPLVYGLCMLSTELSHAGCFFIVSDILFVSLS